MKKENKNRSTQMMMEILKDPEGMKKRLCAGKRLVTDLFILVEMENAEAIELIAEQLSYDPDQLADDIIDLYDLFSHSGLS